MNSWRLCGLAFPKIRPTPTFRDTWNALTGQWQRCIQMESSRSRSRAGPAVVGTDCPSGATQSLQLILELTDPSLRLGPGRPLGRVMSSRTTPNANRAAKALRLAANALHRSDSALGAFLRRKKAQLGVPKAITAKAHKLTRIIYSMLKHGQRYVDAGSEYYERQYRQRALGNAKRRAAQLGYKLVPISDGRYESPAVSLSHAMAPV